MSHVKQASKHSSMASVLIIFIADFETGSLYVALAVLELPIYTRLVSNSQRSACLCICLASARIKIVHHNTETMYFSSFLEFLLLTSLHDKL